MTLEVFGCRRAPLAMGNARQARRKGFWSVFCASAPTQVSLRSDRRLVRALLGDLICCTGHQTTRCQCRGRCARALASRPKLWKCSARKGGAREDLPLVSSEETSMEKTSELRSVSNRSLNCAVLCQGTACVSVNIVVDGEHGNVRSSFLFKMPV